ncbi:RNA polymerase sigma-70 factor [Spirosoma sp. KCTC 42546]|uniref:RNA polymerase sigma-70 factor n=1 Tax=Spirosoma sp. KCTC 42546 TaxID=2520506 RepID=UPI00115BBDF8|nr:RNA polymerase sigma-70 factor [Spirosoma sp. KCTC 42546]QDK79047.1 RNA polymerase sigma-70 factor [Spirosoma sp. KCTC 42546]
MSVLKQLTSAKKSPVAASESLELDSLFKEFYDRLVYFSVQLIRDQAQAQDITQDAFIKYWQEREAIFPNKVAIKNYLYSTVRNASLNVIRHNKVVDDYQEQHRPSESEELTIMDAIISSEVMAELHSAIEALPANYRTISEMSYLEGKKNQEIADELGMSINTVKKQKQRALELLRMRLSPEVFTILLTLGSAHIM